METVLIIAGAIATIGGAIAAIGKYVVKPINSLSSKMEKIDRLEAGQKKLMRAQAQTMEHLISGNNVAELREQYHELLDFLTEQ